MAEPNRIREKRNLTLSPAGVAKLLEVGKSRTVPEHNLSRLVDDAIAEYIEYHRKPQAEVGKRRGGL